MRPAGIVRLLPALVVLASACVGEAPSEVSTTSSVVSATPSTSTTPSTTVSPPSRPPGVPPGVPSSFDRDVPAAEVPPGALVPADADATGVWFAETAAGEAIVVAWIVPGDDPFRSAGGFVAWRRSAGATRPWSPILGTAHTQEDRILGTRTVTADVTGDGSADAIVTEETGGSGACGRRHVLDLAAGRVVWRRSLCDADLSPSVQPAGLTLVEAVFKPSDAHCCPSRIRTTVLTYDGRRWTRASVHVRPT